MKQEEHDSKKRIAFPILIPEGRAFAEKAGDLHVVPTGKWQHPVYGEMEITPSDIAEFVRNFKDKVRRDIPITAGHDNGMNGGELEAIGWFKELYDRGVNGLWAYVEWTDEGARLLQEGAFKYFSPEFYEEYSDPETGRVYHNVLVGGALTNKPYFKELEAPVLSFSEPVIMNQFNEHMDLNTIVAKKAEELSADEKAFLREHKGELDADQQSAFASVLEEAAPEEKPAEEPLVEEDKPAEETTPVVASEKGKVITMSEAEVNALRKAADDGAKALQKIEASERSAIVKKMIFSAQNLTGKFLPKQETAVESFVKTLSEKQRDQFVNIVNNMPKGDPAIFAEIGDSGAQPVGASGIAAQVQTMANDMVKASEGKLTFSAALKKLFAEKPELKQQYEAALAEGTN